jgi:hypothetical protein
MIRKVFYLLIIALLVAAPVVAQNKEGITAKVYEVKNRKVDDIAKLLVGLDVDLESRSINSAFNTFTVRADQQGHTTVEELIRKYDIPVRTIEFQFFFIKASTMGEGLKDGLPEKVQKAMKEVASLTRYKGFELIDSPYLLTREGSSQSSMSGEGIYNYRIIMTDPEITTDETLGNRRRIKIWQFNVEFNSLTVLPDGKKTKMDAAQLSTALSIDEGVVTVIGASQIGREGKDSGAAIITIVTAKIL